MSKNIITLVSGVLLNPEGDLLVLRRSLKNKTFKGCWQLPEGKIEMGELPEEALKREIKEETNLLFKSCKIMFAIASTTTVLGERYHLVRIMYKVDFEGEVFLCEDHDKFMWVNFKNKKGFAGKKIAGLEEILKRL
jgi:8-oxo-dGTP diphosphatase